MTIQDFNLDPYLGAHPIIFEMRSAEVQAVLGPAPTVRMSSLGELNETRGPIGIRYSKDDDKVVEIGLVPPARLIFHGRDLMEQVNLVECLREFEDVPYEGLGFLVFFKLGITATGFGENDESQKAITVFRRGRWDKHRPKLNPWKGGQQV